MTSKEKAEELINKFVDIVIYDNCSEEPLKYLQIRAALICVEEIIDQWEYIDTYLADLGGKLNPNLKYWYEVKKELLKLQ